MCGCVGPRTLRALAWTSSSSVSASAWSAREALGSIRVVRARLYRFRDGLLVFFIGVVLLCVAAAVYLLADLLVAAAPVVMLASLIAVSRVASNAPRRGVGQWGGAGGACCEDHLAFSGELLGFAVA